MRRPTKRKVAHSLVDLVTLWRPPDPGKTKARFGGEPKRAGTDNDQPQLTLAGDRDALQLGAPAGMLRWRVAPGAHDGLHGPLGPTLHPRRGSVWLPARTLRPDRRHAPTRKPLHLDPADPGTVFRGDSGTWFRGQACDPGTSRQSTPE